MCVYVTRRHAPSLNTEVLFSDFKQLYKKLQIGDAHLNCNSVLLSYISYVVCSPITVNPDATMKPTLLSDVKNARREEIKPAGHMLCPAE